MPVVWYVLYMYFEHYNEYFTVLLWNLIDFIGHHFSFFSSRCLPPSHPPTLPSFHLYSPNTPCLPSTLPPFSQSVVRGLIPASCPGSVDQTMNIVWLRPSHSHTPCVIILVHILPPQLSLECVNLMWIIINAYSTRHVCPTI